MLVSIIVARPDLPSRQSRTLLLKCDFCSREFNSRFKRSIAEKQKHYCNKRCAWDAKKIDPSILRVRNLTCQCCGVSFEVTRNTNLPDSKACSRSCASSLRSRRLNLVANMQTPEVRAQAMKTRSMHWKDGTVIHGMKGKCFPCSEERKAVLREKNGGMRNAFFGKRHTEEMKQKMRDARSRLIVMGKMNWSLFGHKSGTHVSTKIGRSVHFRSSWEEVVMKYLDTSLEVLTWDYECVRIPYYYDNHKRWYVPDFLVVFQDCHYELWEVKPKEFVGAEKTVLKSEAAQAWCVENNVARYCVIDKDRLRSML